MKPQPFIFILLFFFSAQFAYCQENTEDKVLEAAKLLTDKMAGKWETYKIDTDRKRDDGTPAKPIRIEYEIAKMPNAVGVQGTGKTYYEENGEERIHEGSFMFLYSRREQIIRYLWWHKNGNSVYITYDFAGDKWISKSDLGMDILYFDGDEMMEEQYDYDENGKHNGYSISRSRKVK